MSLLLFLLGAVTGNKPGARRLRPDGPHPQPSGPQYPRPEDPPEQATWPGQPPALPAERPAPDGSGPQDPGGQPPGRRPRRRIPRWAGRAAVLVLILLIFRRAVAWVVLTALSAALHLIGLNVHLPSIRFGWPWQTITAGTTVNTDLGPWVLQKIEGITKPAFGQANFSFYFTHKVSKSIGPLPCWYASTFYAVGHASATVNLNPGPAWWAPSAGHYQLQVLSRPAESRPGHVRVTMVLPQPQLPQTSHDVVIDNIPSRPVDTQHSWTYPGLACGLVLRPQFPQSVLYAQAQQIAFGKARQSPQITSQLVSKAESTAAQTIRNNFIQPTVNAFGYTLDRLTVRWAAAP